MPLLIKPPPHTIRKVQPPLINRLVCKTLNTRMDLLTNTSDKLKKRKQKRSHIMFIDV